MSFSGILSYIEEKAPALLEAGEFSAADLCFSLQADILFLKHESSIFRQSSNPVGGSWKIQFSFLWAKQRRA